MREQLSMTIDLGRDSRTGRRALPCQDTTKDHVHCRQALPLRLLAPCHKTKRLAQTNNSGISLKLLQEEEQRLKPGTHKFVMFQVLRNATVEGMTIQGIVDKAIAIGFKQFEEVQKSSLSAVRISAFQACKMKTIARQSVECTPA